MKLKGWPFELPKNSWIDPCGDEGPGPGPGNPH